MDNLRVSRRGFLRVAGAVASALPFLRGEQPASAATAKAIGLASTHPVGKTKLYTSVSPSLFVTRTGTNTWVAFDNICTHAGAQLVLQGKQAFCRAHGATFNPATGKPTNNVARTALRSYPVSIRKGKIFVTV
ncbi:MAG: Rieske (2Fe-2S) protein [Actinomycetales bacterium]|nr:Rieske (2Fe-2S) protein [Actinomycetales bacterium]